MNGPTIASCNPNTSLVKNGTVFVNCTVTGFTDHDDLRVRNDIQIVAVNSKYTDRFSTEDQYAN